jgi:hypothetical protein
MLLADCQDFLRSEDWYVPYLAFAGVREFRGITGTLKGVNSFHTVHVKMQVFMVVYSERDALSTRVFAIRCAKKVFFYPEVKAVLYADAIVKWQDLSHLFTCWRAGPGNLCSHPHIEGVRI